MKRAAQFAVDFLLASVVAIFLLAAGAELERRDESAVRALKKQHQAEAKVAKWRELDATSRYMTAYDQIGKRK